MQIGLARVNWIFLSSGILSLKQGLNPLLFLFAGSEPRNTDFRREGFRFLRVAVAENFGILGDFLELRWRRILEFSLPIFKSGGGGEFQDSQRRISEWLVAKSL